MPRSDRRFDLLKKRLDVFTHMLEGVEKDDPRALHRARVASRRLRELVPVLQLDERTAARLGRRLRKVTAALGEVRELDVLFQVTNGLEAPYPKRAVDRVRTAIARDREEARCALAGACTVAEARRIAAKLRRLLEADPREEPARGDSRAWTWVIDARVARRASNLREAIDRAGTAYVPERLHDVRIALKKLRYALELAAEARGQKTTPTLRALTRGQDLLGELHDLQTLIARTRVVSETAAGDSPASRDLDALTDRLEIECRHLHARFLRERSTLVSACDRFIATASRSARPEPARVRRSA